ncbi:MAG: glyoxalase [SAR202 cluster bacterium Io17-Chloro-G9]|nr:MAG: glyoxalase [SAR202 cluster bacterium Io17-Chloro-G9]
MAVTRISAVTLAVGDMARSVAFYQSAVGLELLYGGRGEDFTSFRLGDGFLNLILVSKRDWSWWGRVILYVDDVDAMYQQLTAAGQTPSTAPQDAPWGERFFHINDPDGHELSFARLFDQ